MKLNNRVMRKSFLASGLFFLTAISLMVTGCPTPEPVKPPSPPPSPELDIEQVGTFVPIPLASTSLSSTNQQFVFTIPSTGDITDKSITYHTMTGGASVEGETVSPASGSPVSSTSGRPPDPKWKLKFEGVSRNATIQSLEPVPAGQNRKIKISVSAGSGLPSQSVVLAVASCKVKNGSEPPITYQAVGVIKIP